MKRRYKAHTGRNCLQCCIAGLLDMPLDMVPTVDEWEEEYGNWYTGYLSWIRDETDHYSFKLEPDQDIPLGLHIEVYKVTDQPICHAIICKGHEVFHNPSPSVACEAGREVQFRFVLRRRDADN